MPYCLGELSWDKQKAFEEFERETTKMKKLIKYAMTILVGGNLRSIILIK